MPVFRIGRAARVRYIQRAISGYVGSLDAAEMYRNQPALRAVVSFIADNIKTLPLKVYRRDGESRERVRDSVAALLIEHPNDHDTTAELLGALLTDYLLNGRALLFLAPDSSSPSGWSMTAIPSAWILDTETIDGFTPSRYLIDNPSTDGEPTWFDASMVVEFKMADPTDPLACAAPIDALKQVLSEQMSAWAFRNAVWKNGGWVNRYLYRPKDAPEWSPEAKGRFVQSWKEKFSGKGDDTGGTPLLEDGMELRDSGFNAREAQWREATILAREDVAAVYHINPAHVWHTEAQTYASAKDNARALYTDAFAPILEEFAQRFNRFVFTAIGADPREYCEFDLQAKLQGSFEEQASVIQSSVGAPWMTINEARARLNLPAIGGGDELVVPLNVLVGGLASPNDTDPTRERYNAAQPQAKAAPAELKSRGVPDDRDAQALTDAIKKFTKRQRARVLQDLAKGAKADGDPEWFDSERWNRELAEDLVPLFMEQATKRGRRAMRDLDGEYDWFDSERIEAYIAAMARAKAEARNRVTLRQLIAALDGDEDSDALGATAEGVFEKAETSRAEMEGISFATAVAGWAVMEACRQRQTSRQKLKRWVVTSSNPRASHAALNGETVPFDEPFSNGADFPGDRDLEPEETCNCCCQIEVIIR